MTEQEFKEIIAEKLLELIEEFEHCFDSSKLAELQRKIEACHTLIGLKKLSASYEK